MTRAAWTAGALAPDELEALAEDLSGVLPYPEDAQQAFLIAVDEALAEYEKLRIPAQDDARARKERIARLAKTAQNFAWAVADLDEDSADLVELSMWAAAGKTGDPPIQAVRKAGELVGRVSEGAQYLIEHPSQPGRDKTILALDGFIGELGRAYLAAFRQRPSPVLNGPFAKSLTPIFRAAGINVRVSDPPDKGGPATDDPTDPDQADIPLISKTRLDRIIKTRVLGGAPLRPGRKPVSK